VGPSPSTPDVPGDPSNPYDLEACLRDDGTFGDTHYSGESGDTNKNHLTCDLQQAGPYKGTIDLDKSTSSVTSTHFRTTQVPVNGEDVGEQVPINPIISSANLMVQSFANPLAGTISYEGLGCVILKTQKARILPRK
jgi:hypothetical protein